MEGYSITQCPKRGEDAEKNSRNTQAYKSESLPFPDPVRHLYKHPYFLPLQECSGSFSLSGIKVQPTQMEEDVGLETLFVPIPKGLFDQTLDFIVEALNGTIG